MAEPRKGQAFEFYVSLGSFAGGFVVDPPIVAGDFKIVVDGGAASNLNTLPVVSPAGTSNVKIVLSAAEMNGNKIVILAVDQTATKAWKDLSVFIDAPVSNADDISKILRNRATLVNEVGATKLITFYEDDGITKLREARINATGTERVVV